MIAVGGLSLKLSVVRQGYMVTRYSQFASSFGLSAIEGKAQFQSVYGMGGVEERSYFRRFESGSSGNGMLGWKAVEIRGESHQG